MTRSLRRRWFRAVLSLLGVGSAVVALGASPEPAGILPPDARGWVRVQGAQSSSNEVFTISASSNLVDWTAIAVLHDAPVDYVDAGAPRWRNRFYRITGAVRTAEADWKNQIALGAEPFLTSTGSGSDEVRWVKFAILTAEPDRVYYQDSQRYPFHFEFATARLDPFRGMPREAFDRVSLHPGPQQQAVLGAVLVPPGQNVREYGIQLVGAEAYSPEEVVHFFELVKSSVRATGPVEAFYMPTFEQLAGAEANRAFLESKGVRLASVARWGSGDTCYASGWALGRLQWIPATEIAAAYADGRLLPDDILLTDAIPAELPFLAGIVALSPSTPNSHVAILARSQALPFVYLASEVDRNRARGFAGQPVLLRASGSSGQCQVKLVPLIGSLSPDLQAQIAALKAPVPVQVVPKAAFGARSASVDGLIPSDSKYFGGKAANFGVLRRQIPGYSPPAVAFSFDLWDEFMAQVLPGGKSLAAEIASRLGGYSYPPNVALLRADLEAVRDLITGGTQFTAAQQDAILAALSSFPPTRKVRFRSSTNVEDSEQYSGAGLYDSYSGCPADDLDADARGPSLCDPAEANERGVFRAIKKVYASFYNENAFLERLRLGVKEDEVGMAVLAHLSTPDETELANGVGTLLVQDTSLQGQLVTQAGAASVTNPDGNAQPEIVEASRFTFGTFLDLKQRSGLVVLGSHVLDWESDYRKLLDLFASVADGYRAFVPGKDAFTLDFEYKKVAPGELLVKQVRQVPSPASGKSLTPVLLNEPGTYCVFQGEFGDVFANHRLKSRWSLATHNLRLSSSNLTSSFYRDATAELLVGTNRVVLTNGTASWPLATHALEGGMVKDSWTLPGEAGPMTFSLETRVPLEVFTPDSPLLTLGDLPNVFAVQYPVPMPTVNFDGKPAWVTNEVVRLWHRAEVTSESLLQQRVFKAGAIRIESTFYWPKPPGGASAGYTAPLQDWVETRIEGFTSAPIVLRGYYAQTYRPDHHNFSESFIFEPRLDPEVPHSLLSDLEAADVRLIYVRWGDGVAAIWFLGRDGQFRSAL